MKQRIFDVIPAAESITSRTNPVVVSLSKLSSAKHRRELGLFLAEGLKLSEEAAGLPETRYILVSSEDGFASDSVLALLQKAPACARILVLPPFVFEKVSTEGAPQGIITVLAPISRLHSDENSPADMSRTERVLALDTIQDPGNLGTMIRAASAFGYSKIILGNCADIYHPKAVRASMGAVFRMPIDRCTSLSDRLRFLKKDGRRVLSAALMDNCLELGRCELRSDDCIVIGNEGHGVSAEVLSVSDAVIRIPMVPGTESLNAAGAAAVLMWEYYRSFRF